MLIVVGNWNLILDPQLDYNNHGHVNSPEAQESQGSVMFQLGIVTGWDGEFEL